MLLSGGNIRLGMALNGKKQQGRAIGMAESIPSDAVSQEQGEGQKPHPSIYLNSVNQDAENGAD